MGLRAGGLAGLQRKFQPRVIGTYSNRPIEIECFFANLSIPNQGIINGDTQSSASHFRAEPMTITKPQ